MDTSIVVRIASGVLFLVVLSVLIIRRKKNSA